MMPVIGLVLGRSLAHDLGTAATAVAGTLLGVAGAYAIIAALLGDRKPTANPEMSTRRLILIGGAMSIDNLVIGFALGAYHVDLVVAAVTIAAVSIALSAGSRGRPLARGPSRTLERAGRWGHPHRGRGGHRSGCSPGGPRPAQVMMGS